MAIMTVLSNANVLAKTFRKDSSESFSAAALYDAQHHDLRGFDDLADIVKLLAEPDFRKLCVIRGALKRCFGDSARNVLRRYTHIETHTNAFESNPKGCHWVMCDFDEVEAPDFDPDFHLEYLVSLLPADFHDSSYVYQWSSSAGLARSNGKLKAHLWFWLEEPWSCENLKGKAQTENWKCDKAPFNPVQVHYTASPVFEGVSDPFENNRVGVVRKNNSVVSLSPWVKPKPVSVNLTRQAVHFTGEYMNSSLGSKLADIGNPSLHESTCSAVASYFAVYGAGAPEDVIVNYVEQAVGGCNRSTVDIDRLLRDLPRIVSGGRAKYG